MRYFPIFVDLDGLEVLIVGGGEKALQKLRLLAKSTARIRMVAAEFDEGILVLAGERSVTLTRRSFAAGDLAGVVIAFAADDDAATNSDVARAAKALGIPHNVVDGPAESSFIMPAIVDRDPVVVAIGTEGTAPILAREIKAKIEAWLPAKFGRVAEGVIHLKIRAYDQNGNECPDDYGQFGNDFLPSGDVYSYPLSSNTLPNSVQLEVGVLDPDTYTQAKALAFNPVAQPAAECVKNPGTPLGWSRAGNPRHQEKAEITVQKIRKPL